MKMIEMDNISYKKLSEILTIKNGKDYKSHSKGNVPVYGSGGIISYIDTAVYDKPSVLIPRKGSLDKLYFVDTPFWNVDTIFYTEINTELVEPRYLYHYLKQAHLEKLNKAGGVPSLTQAVLNNLTIPLPPLPIQQEVVRILDTFTNLTAELTNKLNAELTARRKQYEYYRDELLTFGEDVPRVQLGDIGPVCMCKRILKSQTNTVGGVPFYKIGTFGKTANAYISEETYQEYRSMYSFPNKGDILISAAGTIGRTVVYDGKPAYFQDSNIVWIANDETRVLNRFLAYCYEKKPWNISTGGTIARLYNENIQKAVIPAPSLERQMQIVSQLEKMEDLCNSITVGLPAEITARQKQYEYYRDKLLTFKENIS